MKKEKKSQQAVKAYVNSGKKTDPNGSYTGNTNGKKGEVPTQDADDL